MSDTPAHSEMEELRAKNSTALTNIFASLKTEAEAKFKITTVDPLEGKRVSNRSFSAIQAKLTKPDPGKAAPKREDIAPIEEMSFAVQMQDMAQAISGLKQKVAALENETEDYPVADEMPVSDWKPKIEAWWWEHDNTGSDYVRIGEGCIRKNGNYYTPESIVGLSGTYCWVFAQLVRATNEATIQASSVEPTSDSTNYIKMLYKFEKTAGGIWYPTYDGRMDVSLDLPTR